MYYYYRIREGKPYSEANSKKGDVMKTKEKAPSMNEVLDYLSRFADEKPGHSLNAAFCFLYKEILLNRILIMESSPTPNRAGIEHNEQIVNELNQKLMKRLG